MLYMVYAVLWHGQVNAFGPYKLRSAAVKAWLRLCDNAAFNRVVVGITSFNR